MSLEKDMLSAMKSSIVSFLSSDKWFTIDWGNRIVLQKEWLMSVFNLIDFTIVNQHLKDKIERHIADKIFHSMAQEIATDIKKIVSNNTLRDDVRYMIRKHIEETVKAMK